MATKSSPFNPGKQNLNGEQAPALVRNRKSPGSGGGFGRSRRQMAIGDKGSMDHFPASAGSLIGIFSFFDPHSSIKSSPPARESPDDRAAELQQIKRSKTPEPFLSGAGVFQSCSQSVILSPFYFTLPRLTIRL